MGESGLFYSIGATVVNFRVGVVLSALLLASTFYYANIHRCNPSDASKLKSELRETASSFHFVEFGESFRLVGVFDIVDFGVGSWGGNSFDRICVRMRS